MSFGTDVGLSWNGSWLGRVAPEGCFPACACRGLSLVNFAPSSPEQECYPDECRASCCRTLESSWRSWLQQVPIYAAWILVPVVIPGTDNNLIKVLQPLHLRRHCTSVTLRKGTMRRH
jgi:hypothetical protein